MAHEFYNPPAATTSPSPAALWRATESGLERKYLSAREGPVTRFPLHEGGFVVSACRPNYLLCRGLLDNIPHGGFYVYNQTGDIVHRQLFPRSIHKVCFDSGDYVIGLAGTTERGCTIITGMYRYSPPDGETLIASLPSLSVGYQPLFQMVDADTFVVLRDDEIYQTITTASGVVRSLPARLDSSYKSWMIPSMIGYYLLRRYTRRTGERTEQGIARFDVRRDPGMWEITPYFGSAEVMTMDSQRRIIVMITAADKHHYSFSRVEPDGSEIHVKNCKTELRGVFVDGNDQLIIVTDEVIICHP